MSLSKLLTTIMLIATISIFFVHQQTELIKQSYELRSNQNKLDDLLDRNRILEYNVIALKAPTNLESRLTAYDIKLVSPERRQVVRLANSSIEKESKAIQNSQPQMASFLSFFTLSREAQAKPTD